MTRHESIGAEVLDYGVPGMHRAVRAIGKMLAESASPPRRVVAAWAARRSRYVYRPESLRIPRRITNHSVRCEIARTFRGERS